MKEFCRLIFGDAFKPMIPITPLDLLLPQNRWLCFPWLRLQLDHITLSLLFLVYKFRFTFALLLAFNHLLLLFQFLLFLLLLFSSNLLFFRAFEFFLFVNTLTA